MMQADWFVDPVARFDGRFFDGVRWTNQVSDDGLLRTDLDWPTSPGEATDPPVAEPEQRTTQDRRLGDRRQINTKRHGLDERRNSERRQRKIVIPKA